MRLKTISKRNTCLIRTQSFYISLLIGALFSKSSFSENTIALSDTINTYSVSTLLKVYEDKTSLQTITSLDASLFSECKSVRFVPNMGFSNSTYWFMFCINDNSSRQREWVLDIAMPSLHEVDFYAVDTYGKILYHTRSGFTNNKLQKSTPFRNPSIEFSGFPGKKVTVFTRIKSETPIIAPVFLREKKKYIEYDRMREFILGLYFGALIVMALYHFYLYLSTHDRGYLWLVLFILCFGFGQMTAVYGYLADWGIKKPDEFLPWLHFVNYLAAFFALLLSRDMIKPEKYTPSCNLILKILIVTTLIVIPLSPFMSFMLAERVLLLFNILPLPFFIYSALIAYRKGHRPALFYLIAASVFIAGIAIYNLMYGFDLLPFNEFTYFVPNLSFTITLTLFSIGLADFINSIKREREQAREQALIDLNEKLRLQEEKTIIQQELEQSRKLEAIGRVMAGVAHDMNNFLNPIIGYALLLRSDCQVDTKLFKHADQMVNATNRLKELASTLIDISRKKPNGITEIDLNNAAGQIGSLLKHSCPRTIAIKFNYHSEKLCIRVDIGMVHSAILNVGINAIDAMPDGGAITITTSKIFLETNHSARRKFDIPEGDYAMVSVTDSGMGMRRDVLNHIFEPFFTTKDYGKGTGLGLVNVYNCMVAHKGCVEIESQRGVGTKVSLYFPMMDKEGN